MSLSGRSVDAGCNASVRALMTQNNKGFIFDGPLVQQDRPPNTVDGGQMVRTKHTKLPCSLNLLFKDQADVLAPAYCASSGMVFKKDRTRAIQTFFDNLDSALNVNHETEKRNSPSSSILRSSSTTPSAMTTRTGCHRSSTLRSPTIPRMAEHGRPLILLGCLGRIRRMVQGRAR